MIARQVYPRYRTYGLVIVLIKSSSSTIFDQPSRLRCNVQRLPFLDSDKHAYQRRRSKYSSSTILFLGIWFRLFWWRHCIQTSWITSLTDMGILSGGFSFVTTWTARWFSLVLLYLFCPYLFAKPDKPNQAHPTNQRTHPKPAKNSP